MIRPYVSFLLLLTAAVAADSQVQEPLLLRQPTVSQTHVVFCYAGDLWIVSREGGEAKRLTSGPGDEVDPVFSPDGTLVAFSRDSGSGAGV